jgi:hypothetical protein
VNWFAIGYGEGSAVEFPHHHTWPLHGTCARRLREFNAILDGAERVADIGLVHTWQGLAAERSNYNVAHRVGMMRLALAATRQNVGLYIAGIDALGRATVRGSQIVIDGQALSGLVVPWPFFLEAAARRKLEEFMAAGGRCLLYGQRPAGCPENEGVLKLLEGYFGRQFVSRERKVYDFETTRLMGAGVLKKRILEPGTEETEDKSAVRFRERCGTEHIQMQYNPLQLERGTPLLSRNRDVLGVKAADRPLYFFSCEVPLYGAALKALLPQLLEGPTAATPPHLYLQRYCRRGTELLAVCARTPEGSIAGKLPFGGHEITLPDGKMAIVSVGQGKRRTCTVRTW